MKNQSFVEICLRQGKYNVYLICFDDLYAIEENVSWDEAVKSAIKSSKKHNRTVRIFANSLNDGEFDEMLLVAIVMNADDNAQLFISKDILDNPLQIVKCEKRANNDR